MIDGDLVVVVGKLDNNLVEKYKNKLVVGTFLGKISDNKVMVLLPCGNIFTGSEYEVIMEVSQSDNKAPLVQTQEQ